MESSVSRPAMATREATAAADAEDCLDDDALVDCVERRARAPMVRAMDAIGRDWPRRTDEVSMI